MDISVRNFFLSDVRCFDSEQRFNIRPLTFLVGENSTGKSTVLGCMQALANLIGEESGRRPFHNFNFNCIPYELGSFSDILRKSRTNPKERFSVGFELLFGSTKKLVKLTYELSERETGSEPIICKISMKFELGKVDWIFSNYSNDEYSESNIHIESKYAINDKRNEIQIRMQSHPNDEISNFTWPFLGLILLEKDLNRFKLDESQLKTCQEILKFFYSVIDAYQLSNHPDYSDEIIMMFRRIFPPYYDIKFNSLAPIRSKPKRTYDSLAEIEDPEGVGVPMTLVNMYRGDRNRWKRLKQRLDKFGQSSGLFESINVKPFGKSSSDPFQLKLKIRRGPEVNLVDVGYGVSQILPILGRVLNSQKRTFLMQQPELHLHPRAQAELSSLFVSIYKELNHAFIIETHSDYMVDRARIEIMNGRIDPVDVSLIYFEANGELVEVHNIEFDRQANLIGAPENFRKFFQVETDHLLGIRD